MPFALRIRLPTPEPSRLPKSSESLSIWKPGAAARAARKRKSSSVMVDHRRRRMALLVRG